MSGNGMEMVRASGGLAIPGAHVTALESMTDAEFSARLALLKKGQERMRQIQKDLLQKGEDFGHVPHVDKPMLLKPGAEKLCKFYGLVPTFEVTRTPGDGTDEPVTSIVVTCTIRAGSETGPVIATGMGSCNSGEKKYRKSDPFDIDNTLVKMAVKRAFVDATLRATATSGLFSQDLEEGQEDQRAEDLESIAPIVRKFQEAKTVAALEAIAAGLKDSKEMTDLRRSARDLLKAEYRKVRDAVQAAVDEAAKNPPEVSVAQATEAPSATQEAPRPTSEDFDSARVHLASLNCCTSLAQLEQTITAITATAATPAGDAVTPGAWVLISEAHRVRLRALQAGPRPADEHGDREPGDNEMDVIDATDMPPTHRDAGDR